ncbi:MAG: VWA domain-containing protein [Candidatus Eisenbacteria bacterium]
MTTTHRMLRSNGSRGLLDAAFRMRRSSGSPRPISPAHSTRSIAVAVAFVVSLCVSVLLPALLASQTSAAATPAPAPTATAIAATQGLGASVGGNSDLLLVLDGSGSMWGQIQGENKIVIARRVLGDLIGELSDDRNVALIAYGHRSEGDCDDIETVTSLGPLDRAALSKTIETLNPKGKTPITAALRRAVDIARTSGRKSTVILVSDGLETCGGDPCALVQEAKAAGVDFVLHVIGFDVAKEDVSSLECAAQAGDGLYLTADNAAELSGAMETAVALPADIPTGRLVVKAVMDGELQDVAIQVFDRGSRSKVGGGRTYRSPATNPREIPLADGAYDVTILALGLEGNRRQEFGIEIANGSTVEKLLDFSSGTLSIGATRNDRLSDVLFKVYVRGTKEVAAQGRTYRDAATNPKTVSITPGEYDVELTAIEMGDNVTHRFRPVTVAAGKTQELMHDFASGEAVIRVARADGTLVDATVKVTTFDGTVIGSGRARPNPDSNPQHFDIPPGSYLVKVQVIGGDRLEQDIEIAAGERTTVTVEVP